MAQQESDSSLKINISDPCPMLLMRMKKGDGTFYCGSCSEKVMDYRGKGKLKKSDFDHASKCGIFDENQLSQSVRFSFKNKVLFFLLACCSFLGFTVKPLKNESSNNGTSNFSAQDSLKTDSVQVDTVPQMMIGEAELIEEKSDTTRRRRKRHKKGKRKFTPVGCPSF